jgi:hypothetical protein
VYTYLVRRKTMTKQCAEPKAVKRKNFFMPKFSLASDDRISFYLARGQKRSAQSKEAGSSYKPSFKASVCPSNPLIQTLLGLLYRWIRVLLICLQSAYNVSVVIPLKSIHFSYGVMTKSLHWVEYLIEFIGSFVLKRTSGQLNYVRPLIISLIVWGFFVSNAFAYTNEQIANAIYKAEGGAKTRHPYGILTKYKKTTPRQACLNTIKNQRIRHAKHNCGKDFLTCLRDRYCPIGCDNDNGTNKNWLKNVRYFLAREVN